VLPSLDVTAVRAIALSLAVLLASSRLLSHVLRRHGVPPVVGELVAGLTLGPSVLGAIAPGVSEQIVPPGGAERAVLDGLAWLGVVFLLASAGTHLDLRVLGRRLRPVAWLAGLSLAVPMAAGLAVGWWLPESLVGDADRASVAAIMAVILGISALPTTARTLRDLELESRDVGQWTLVVAAFDDVVGWILLAILTAGMAGDGATHIGFALIQVALFMAGVSLVGQRVVDLVLGLSVRMTETVAGPLTAYVVLVLSTVLAAVALDLDAVVGALAAGVVLGRSPSLQPRVQMVLDDTTTAFLGPLFFVLAGAAVDVRELRQPRELVWTAALVVVAIGAKVGGAVLGAGLAGLNRRLGLAVGVGLSMRGGLGIVVAAVALTSGVLSDAGYAAAVIVAVATSIIAPPALAKLAAQLPIGEGEETRLDRHAVVQSSPAVGARRVLLLTRGGGNSRVAARALDLALEPSATVTVLVVAGPAEQGGVADHTAADQHTPWPHGGTAAELAERVASLFGHRRTQVRVVAATDIVEAICDEASRGYDLVVSGTSGEVQAPAQLGEVLQQLLLRSPVPVLLVRSRTDAEGLTFRRLLTVTDGTAQARAAQDVAFSLAMHGGADVDVLHVIDRSDRILHQAWFRNAETQPAPLHLLAEATQRAELFGIGATTHARVGGAMADELLNAGRELQADTLVVATTARKLADRPFLGHGVEYLLEHATQNLVILSFPGDD